MNRCSGRVESGLAWKSQELRRVVRTALHGFFHDLYTRVTARLSDTARATLDQLLVVGHDEMYFAD